MVQCELSDRIWRVAGRTTLSIYSIDRDSWCIAITQLEQFEDSTKKNSKQIWPSKSYSYFVQFLTCVIIRLYFKSLLNSGLKLNHNITVSHNAVLQFKIQSI